MAQPGTLSLAHAAGDSVIALSCFVIASSLAYLARKHRGARLARVFAVFGVLFLCGGLMHVCEVGGWYGPGALFKALTALSCAACAVVTVKCVPAAHVMFTRLAVMERRIDERLVSLRTDPRYDTPGDAGAAKMLSEIKDLARLAREATTREEV